MEAECNKLMEQQFELQQSLREVAECLKLPNAHELHGYKTDAVTKLVIGAINKLVDECDRLTEALDELQADPLGDVLVRVENERDHLRKQMDQQRAMLTEQRDEARAKVLKLESENAEWRRGAERDADKLESLTGAYNDSVAECDELRKKLENVLKNARDALNEAAGRCTRADEERRNAEPDANKRNEYREMFERYRDAYVKYVGKYNIAVKEREELRKSLRIIAEHIGIPHYMSLSMYKDKTLAEVTLETIDSKNKYIGVLERQCDELQAKLEEMHKTHVELPKDATGDYWRIGDESEYGEVTGIIYNNTRTFIEVRTDSGERAAFGASLGRKAKPVNIEQVIRDLTLGKITESQAVERIEGINGQG